MSGSERANRGSYRVVIPCSESQPERKHRWRWRETHYRMPDGAPIWDEWCERCGNWFVDVIEHPVGRSGSGGGRG